MGKLLLVLKVELGNGTTGAIEVGSGADTRPAAAMQSRASAW